MKKLTPHTNSSYTNVNGLTLEAHCGDLVSNEYIVSFTPLFKTITNTNIYVYQSKEHSQS